MCPILFKIKNFVISPWGIFVGLGVFCAYLYILNNAKKEGISKDQIDKLALLLLVGGFIGGRILYVILNISYYRYHLIEIIISRAGFAFYGTIFMGIIIICLYSKLKGLSILKLGDLLAPGVALGESIGRWGCFFYGCCYGKPTSLPWGVHFHPLSPAALKFGYGTKLHPTQIYSSLTAFIIFIILHILYKKSLTSEKVTSIQGKVFLTYLLVYSTCRFLLEYLRGDSTPFLFSLSFMQLLSLLVILITLITIFWYKICLRYK
jgi:phosphatidylglycerol:prolipoprotein diacylglycerol transferase